MKKQIWILFIVGLVITSVVCSFASLSSTDVDQIKEEIEQYSQDLTLLGNQPYCADPDTPSPKPDVDPDGLEG